ncbi:DUF6069 family protein [Arthrobacter sp. NPDC093125]|uniref:DUF6069 family protein n=1 Tax=Arthrobacter sp. NPDC093125 TaxID=3363944 RepID=UPI00380FC115
MHPVVDTPPVQLAVRRSPWSVALGLCAAALAGVGANAVIALAARIAGVPGNFQPLNPPSYTFLTVFGVLLGALGWAVTRAVSKNPRKLLSWLVPVVVLASCIPDLFLLEQGSAAGVLAAVLMHVAPAVIAVPVYKRLLPLPS